MRKYYYLIATVLLTVASCTPKQKYDVSVSVKNINTDMAIVEARNILDINDGFIDTVYTVKDLFAFDYPANTTYESTVTFFNEGNLLKTGSRPVGINFTYFPGDKLKIDVDMTNEGKIVTRITGSEIYEDMQKFNNNHRYEYSKSDSITSLVYNPDYPGNKDSLRDEVNNIRRKIHAEKKNYIINNPDKDFSGYLLSSLSMEEFDKYYQTVSSGVRNGKLKDFIDMLRKRNEEEHEAGNFRTETFSGRPACDFTLKNTDGNLFSLSSLRGKYVVLNFWGSWCGWCIQDIPDMKSLYEKYKGRLEIVGIDCMEPEKTWQKAVKEYALPWINVYNGENGIDTKYGVSEYPTRVIINKEGGIIETFDGEDAEFYVFIEKIMDLSK